MDTKTILSEASDRMQKTIEHLEEELLNIRAGKASPTDRKSSCRERVCLYV